MVALLDQHVVRRILRHRSDLCGASVKVDGPVGRTRDVYPHTAIAQAVDRGGFLTIFIVEPPIVVQRSEVADRGAIVATRADREIAETLFLTEGTVKNHVTNIIGKLGVRDRTQAELR